MTINKLEQYSWLFCARYNESDDTEDGSSVKDLFIE